MCSINVIPGEAPMSVWGLSRESPMCQISHAFSPPFLTLAVGSGRAKSGVFDKHIEYNLPPALAGGGLEEVWESTLSV